MHLNILKKIKNPFFCAIILIQLFTKSYANINNEHTKEKSNFITCDLIGQLGNVMFEVAAATAFALDNNLEVYIPHLKNYHKDRGYYSQFFYRVNTSEIPSNEDMIFHEDMSAYYYNPIKYEPNKNIHIRGFFQSEKFFSKHQDHIKNLFKPKDEITKEIYNKYGDILKNNTTVAVHVRTFMPDRADPQITINRLKYFVIAMEYFPDHFLFLVFSDDMHWTKNNFPKTRKNVIFIENNPYYIDFYLMSFCHHQIVSPNSTFSWWAAWLNNNPNKIVIAPYIWSSNENEDTIPDDWIKIKY